jgi:hypothetical protein
MWGAENVGLSRERSLHSLDLRGGPSGPATSHRNSAGGQFLRNTRKRRHAGLLDLINDWYHIERLCHRRRPSGPPWRQGRQRRRSFPRSRHIAIEVGRPETASQVLSTRWTIRMKWGAWSRAWNVRAEDLPNARDNIRRERPVLLRPRGRSTPPISSSPCPESAATANWARFRETEISKKASRICNLQGSFLGKGGKVSPSVLLPT